MKYSLILLFALACGPGDQGADGGTLPPPEDLLEGEDFGGVAFADPAGIVLLGSDSAGSPTLQLLIGDGAAPSCANPAAFDTLLSIVVAKSPGTGIVPGDYGVLDNANLPNPLPANFALASATDCGGLLALGTGGSVELSALGEMASGVYEVLGAGGTRVRGVFDLPVCQSAQTLGGVVGFCR